MASGKILVTGSSGTIGTRLCEKMLERGIPVSGADWKPNQWKPEVQKLTVGVDLRDEKAVNSSLPRGVSMVVHLAANARVYNSVVDPSLARDNFLTLYNMLEFARKNDVPRFLFASSREVYGNIAKAVLSESDASVEAAESPYSATKLGGEALVRAYGGCYGLPVIIRFSNVYGMYDGSDRVVPLFIRECRKGRDLVVFGRDKKLDFTYIDDAVDGVMLAVAKDKESEGQAFNIASGSTATIVRVAELIKAGIPSKNKIVLKDNRRGEVVKYSADISKARKLLGFSPKVGVEDGIIRSIEWYSENT